MVEHAVIKAIDRTSVHRITSGQVVIDLQTAVKELVENSLDAGATNIEVRFKQYGIRNIEVIDNGSGIAEQDHDSIALKHHTSKLSSFADLTTVRTFGFRGEALSSLCALCESLGVTTTTEPPMGVSLEMESSGKIRKRSKVARQRGTTVTITNLFSPLPVRRKELERNSKREFGKALALLNAYALGPCCATGVRLTVTNQVDKGQKTVQLRTTGASSSRASVSALWGPKALDNVIDLDLTFDVDREKSALKRLQSQPGAIASDVDAVQIAVKGLVSKFSVGAGRTGTDRQFFYVNGRPCALSKIQKAFNEVYRSFNANQAPFILADFIIPTDSCDINVSPDKRTIFLHSEGNLISKLKAALETAFAPFRSTYDVGNAHMSQSTLPTASPLATAKQRASTSVILGKQVEHNDEPSTSQSTGNSTDITSSQEHDEQGQGAGHSETPSSSLQGPHSEQCESPATPQVAITHLNDGDRMDVDSHHSSPPRPAQPAVDSENPELEPVRLESDEINTITVDTSRAAWNRPPIDNAIDEDDQGNVEEELDEGPARKKRKATPPPAVTSKSDSRSTAKSSTGGGGMRGRSSTSRATVDIRQGMRNKIIGFARLGSQVPAIAHLEEPVEGMDQQDGSEEEEEDQLHSSQNANSESVQEEGQISKGLSAPVEGTSNFDKPPSGVIDLTPDDGFDDSQITPIFDVDKDAVSSPLRREEVVTRPEVLRSANNGTGDVSLRFDLEKVSSTWHQLGDRLAPTLDSDLATSSRVPLDAGVSNTEDDDKATDALARVIEKEDFAAMDIIGQFNLGFIVTRRRKPVVGRDGKAPSGIMDDLFIVDQHAADEKYNFETLQETTNIRSQKLFRPQPMELTASDELLALENIDIIRQNGFEVEEDQDCEYESGSKLKLTAQPVSKSTVFGMKDLEELIHLMRDRPTGQMVRCSKARAMFAMRACRKSVMVGMPLNKHQMTLVVQHMGTIDQPWNCPHGRPTMRHLLDVTNAKLHRQPKTIAWATFDI